MDSRCVRRRRHGSPHGAQVILRLRGRGSPRAGAACRYDGPPRRRLAVVRVDRRNGAQRAAVPRTLRTGHGRGGRHRYPGRSHARGGGRSPRAHLHAPLRRRVGAEARRVMNQEQHMQQTPLAGARRLPPGPRGYPVVGSTLAVQRDAIGFVRAVTGRYGDIVSYRFLGRPSVILNHPDYAKHMLQEHNHNYDKEVFTYRMITWFLGDGLLTTSGDAWLRQRRLMQPAFHRKRVAGWSTLMGGVAGRFLDRWERLDTPMIDVADEMILLTLSVVSRALFSLDISDAAGPVGHTFLAINRHYVNYAATLLAPPRVPVPRNRRFKAA